MTIAARWTIGICLVGTGAWAQSDTAGQAFMNTLDEQASAKAAFEFGNEQERKDWSNLPARMHARNGLSFGEMSDAQKNAAHELLRTGLSARGYEKAASVMELDDIWAALTRNPAMFGSDKYWMAIFGAPGRAAPWGWQLDGHHLAINFTSVDVRQSLTPMFFGAEPEVVPSGPHEGLRIFSAEREKAFALFTSFSAEQRAKAVISETIPGDIFEGPGKGGAMETMEGIRASELDDAQRSLLWVLIDEYLNNAPPETAEAQRAKIRADGDDTLHFAWMGKFDEEANIYFRVHGPSVLIEYDNVFVGRANRDAYSNHIHTILREPSNDFGEDLLRKHYAESGHHR